MSLLKAYREWGGEEDKPQIAIVDWEGVPTSSEFRILKDYFVAQGYPALIADPHDLEYNGDYLSVEGFRIDIVYKRVIIHEFLSRFGFGPSADPAHTGKVVFAWQTRFAQSSHTKSLRLQSFQIRFTHICLTLPSSR